MKYIHLLCVVLMVSSCGSRHRITRELVQTSTQEVRHDTRTAERVDLSAWVRDLVGTVEITETEYYEPRDSMQTNVRGAIKAERKTVVHLSSKEAQTEERTETVQEERQTERKEETSKVTETDERTEVGQPLSLRWSWWLLGLGLTFGAFLVWRIRRIFR